MFFLFLFFFLAFQLHFILSSFGTFFIHKTTKSASKKKLVFDQQLHIFFNYFLYLTQQTIGYRQLFRKHNILLLLLSDVLLTKWKKKITKEKVLKLFLKQFLQKKKKSIQTSRQTDQNK